MLSQEAAGQEAFAAAIAQGRYEPEEFDSRENFFAARHVAVIVLEVPQSMVGRPCCRAVQLRA